MQSLVRGAHHAAEHITVKSALNPLPWLCSIVVPILFTTAYYFDRSPTLRSFCAALVYGGLGIAALTALAGVYFVLFRPDKLQSEEYQLRQQALVLMSTTNPNIDPAHILALLKTAEANRRALRSRTGQTEASEGR